VTWEPVALGLVFGQVDRSKPPASAP